MPQDEPVLIRKSISLVNSAFGRHHEVNEVDNLGKVAVSAVFRPVAAIADMGMCPLPGGIADMGMCPLPGSITDMGMCPLPGGITDMGMCPLPGSITYMGMCPLPGGIFYWLLYFVKKNK